MTDIVYVPVRYPDSTSLMIRLDLYSNDIPDANHIKLERDMVRTR